MKNLPGSFFLGLVFVFALTLGVAPGRGATASDLPPLPPLPPTPASSLEFSSGNILVSETNATVSITVVRRGDTNSSTSVNFATSDGTARAGHNYQATKGTLDFAKGDVEKSFKVGILNDPETEPNEFFRVALSQPASGAQLGAISKATVTIFDARSPVTLPPAVSILSPTNGQFFGAGAEIPVAASASDADGTLKSVEVFANGKSLGFATNNPASATPVDIFQFSFKKTTPGVYLLTARAVDNLGATATSLPVVIRVLSPRVPNVVTIRASEPVVSEATPVRPGKFTVTRTGSLLTKLNVRYSISGTASNGVDYAPLSGLVVIPAGASSASIKVTPVPDKAIEGDETVSVKLEQLVFIQQPPPEDDYTVAQPDSATVTITEKPGTNIPPKVSITSPKDGDALAVLADLVIQAEAADADGRVDSVSFFVDGRLVGIDTRSPYRITWHNIKAGSYTLTAVAEDDHGATTKSAPVTIKVIEQNPTPTVTIVAKDKIASEANPKNAGSFRVSRTGNLRTKLNVRYSVSGTAQNGVDYEKLSGEVVFPVGEDEMEIKVMPLPDQIAEGNETVVVTLTQLFFIVKPAPEDDYFVGTPKSATVTILDNPATNPAPKLLITSPKEGATFPSGSDIAISAQVTGTTEPINQVSFSTGDKFLAVVTVPPYSFVWRNVPAGTYKLIASAIFGGDMAISSAPVMVNVQGASAVPFVKRRLASGYVPGQTLQVILQTGPNDNVVTYAVEDEPPTGWRVGAISEGGVFDATRGRVKFGPFFDSKPRALIYEVTPPVNETGARKFNGIGSLDGVQSPIVGDDVINTSSFHPADADPADFRISLAELTAYAAAWKKNLPWPSGPNPIPASYVTRASEIWQNGEEYVFDPQAGSAPLWWVSKKGVHGQAAVARATIVSPAFVSGNSVRRFVSASHEAIEVELVASTSPGVAASAFEESIANGWSVEDVSDGGFFDESSRTIRWGVFSNGQPRSLRYRLVGSTATEAPKFSGRAAFDGRVVEVKFGN